VPLIHCGYDISPDQESLQFRDPNTDEFDGEQYFVSYTDIQHEFRDQQLLNCFWEHSRYRAPENRAIGEQYGIIVAKWITDHEEWIRAHLQVS